MRNKKLNLYEKITNPGLGTCHLLKKKNDGMREVYLLYFETNPQHYIVCESVNGSHFQFVQYFNEIEEALKEFKALK